MNAPDPHFHLTMAQSVRLKLMLIPKMRGYAPSYWLRQNKIFCKKEKLLNPGPWRISYGVMHRFANVLGVTVDQLYKDLNT